MLPLTAVASFRSIEPADTENWSAPSCAAPDPTCTLPSSAAPFAPTVMVWPAPLAVRLTRPRLGVLIPPSRVLRPMDPATNTAETRRRSELAMISIAVAAFTVPVVIAPAGEAASVCVSSRIAPAVNTMLPVVIDPVVLAMRSD